MNGFVGYKPRVFVIKSTNKKLCNICWLRANLLLIKDFEQQSHTTFFVNNDQTILVIVYNFTLVPTVKVYLKFDVGRYGTNNRSTHKKPMENYRLILLKFVLYCQWNYPYNSTFLVHIRPILPKIMFQAWKELIDTIKTNRLMILPVTNKFSRSFVSNQQAESWNYW